MIQLWDGGAYLADGKLLPETAAQSGGAEEREVGRRGTMAYRILQAHNQVDDETRLKIKFDQLTSHDITFVGIIQTARASGLERFPVPYVLTNCHNSLCAVGGTINEDDHLFGLTCAKRYGGVYVPPHQAVIHQYAREMLAGCGNMILGSDSHTRYGALGTMAIGEGGGELAKQLLGRTYDITLPEVVAVYLTGEPQQGVGPQDVALAIIGAVFKNGYVKNKVMEFVGPGVEKLSIEFRMGIDVMTTETTCLSSIWTTDARVEEYLALHGRAEAYRTLAPEDGAYYDGVVAVDLSKVEPMIAMPFHPSNTYAIRELNENLTDILHEVEQNARVSFGEAVSYSLMDKVVNGKLLVEQGIIAGCAGGGFENICDAADILRGGSIGNDVFTLSVYPASMPVYHALMKNGVAAELTEAGAVLKTAFCGPCFGAGDTPANGTFSIRHSTRNFPNREGSKLQNGQLASVALMDARSIAATAANKGILTPATEYNGTFTRPAYFFDRTIYENRVFDSKGKADPTVEIRFGPNIKDWPAMTALTKHLLLRVVAEIHDPVTTTDELIPSGETSSFRSNPLGLAEFTLSRKDPAYVGRAKTVRALEEARQQGVLATNNAQELTEEVRQQEQTLMRAFALVRQMRPEVSLAETAIGSTIYANKPGDGSAREQAASCQKVLGGWANIAREYATKRYRSNLINWGMLPFLLQEETLPFTNGDYLFVPDIRSVITEGRSQVTAYVIRENELKPFSLSLGELTQDERSIIAAGCLINYYKNN